MESGKQNEYAAFEEKVRRTVYLDNLSPNVTESVVRTALDQYGTVKSVEFIPNYLEPRNMPQCALVEMEKEKQAIVVISTLSEFPFMMSGMPRPIRIRWLDTADPDFEVASKLKQLVKRHATETAVMLKHQLEKEEKLAKQQGETLKANYKKYEMIDSLMADGAARRLARCYNLRFSDDSGPSTFH
ncbi:hypothetical protein GOBAR_DD22231 [Gossypium barbadense]|nr:hypothetical protein GOBAR_DD22231 [Gossypium barbadense]